MDSSPLYLQIYHDLKEKIGSGVYSENSYLPAERVLCEIYRVSRSTIRHALDDLQRDGYIVRSQGNGNFVKPRIYDQGLTRAHSFADSLKRQGIQLKSEALGCELISSDKYLDSLDVVKLGAPAGSKWHKLTRLRSAETYPLMIETSYLLQSRFLYVSEDVLHGGSLYAYLEANYGMKITGITETLSPLISNAAERSLLQIPTHVPCMLCERFCYEQDYLTIIHRTVVRGDKYRFKVSYCTMGPIP